MESVAEWQPIQAEVGTYLKLLLICAIFPQIRPTRSAPKTKKSM